MKFVKYITLLALLAGFAFADSLVLTSPGYGGAGYMMGGEYVSPYDARYTNSATGVVTNNLKVICDDFSAVTYLNHTYQITTISFADLPSLIESTRWGKPGITGAYPASTALDLYFAAAYLSNQLLNPVGLSNTDQGVLAYAIWSLFTPSSLNRLNYDPALKAAAAAKAQQALAIVQAATVAQNAATYSNFVLFTPDPLTNPVSPQEFIALRTPEPGVVAIWMIMLMSVGAIVYTFRRPMQQLNG